MALGLPRNTITLMMDRNGNTLDTNQVNEILPVDIYMCKICLTSHSAAVVKMSIKLFCFMIISVNAGIAA